MKILYPFLFLLLLFSHTALFGQASTYTTDPKSGVRYLFFKHNEKGRKPDEGSVTKVSLMYKTETDSVLYDSHTGKSDSVGIISIPIKFPFKGCLEHGISLMSAGDSASFLISSDSLYFIAFKLKALPMYVKPGSTLRFYIKLYSFQTAEEIKDARQKQINKARAELDSMKTREANDIKKYLSANKIKTKPVIIDSFYILERSGKPGRAIFDGDSVQVRYKSMLLDGTIFDQSDSVHGKATFTFQYSHQAHLIRGWIELLATMHEGEKVKMLVPSSMGFGSDQAGKEVQPYSPLIFEIEVLKVKPYN